MGYQIQTILTDGRKVRAIFGSKDFSFLEKIKFDPCNEYDDLLIDYFNLPHDELSTTKLMENIIRGDTRREYSHVLRKGQNEKFAKSHLAAVYGYLHRDICLHFGEIINRNSDNWPMLTSSLAVFENRNRVFFSIPYSLDFPHIFLILNEEIEEYQETYKNKLEEAVPNASELQEDIAFIFSKAKETKLDIFFCNH